MNDWITSSYCVSSDCVQVTWAKSSFCNDSGCVEMAWIKSSHSVTGNCVEVASCTCMDVLVRDSKDPEGPKLQFPKPAFAEFLAGVKANEFDR